MNAAAQRADMPHLYVEALKVAVRNGFSFVDTSPLPPETDMPPMSEDGITAAIGADCVPPWTLCLFVPRDTAAGMIRRLLRFDLAYASRDTESAIAEIADFLGNRMVSELLSRNVRCERTLPASSRALDLTNSLTQDCLVTTLVYGSSVGPFRVQLFGCPPPVACRRLNV